MRIIAPELIKATRGKAILVCSACKKLSIDFIFVSKGEISQVDVVSVWLGKQKLCEGIYFFDALKRILDASRRVFQSCTKNFSPSPKR